VADSAVQFSSYHLRYTTIVAVLATAVLLVEPGRAADQPATGAGDAYIIRDEASDTWTIGNRAIKAVFEVGGDHQFRLLHLINAATGHEWTSAPGADTVATMAGRPSEFGSPQAGFRFVDVSPSATDRSVHLAIAFDDADTRVRVTRHYLVYAGVPAIEAWTRFESDRHDVSVSDLNTWRLPVKARSVEWIDGLLGDAIGAANNDAFSLRQRTLEDGDSLDLGSESRSSERELPYFKLVDGTEALVGGLLWSGAWHLRLETKPAGTELTFGLSGMETNVAASRPIETPHGFLAVASRADESSAVIQAYVEDGLRAGRPFDSLVTYNTWFAYGTRVEEDIVRSEMEHVAQLGAELFVLDAGWYADAGRYGPWDFTGGLGNWRSDEARFPSRLRALTEYAHSLGMKFGIWVEPERIALDILNRGDSADESWLAKSDGRYDPDTDDADTRAAQLCLASDGARAWLLEQITGLIDRAQPDYLKWDNNFSVNCNREGHGHGPSDGNFAHVNGLYKILTTLRLRYPDLLIENVSGGGNRLDYGMMQFTDVGWMDDRTWPSTHVRHNLEGLSSAIPPSYLSSFVIDKESESLQTGSDIRLYLRSRMAGVFGLTFKSAALPPSTASEVLNHVALYKSLRTTIQHGSAILLTRQTSVDDPPAWDAMQETDGAGLTVIFAFQIDPGIDRIRLRPRALDPQAVYDVESIDVGPLGSASGAELMADGIELGATQTSASHVLILSRR
jgi:alpha-galactosidase